MEMKRSNALLRLVSILAFLAVVIYFGVYIVRYFSDSYTSTTVSYCTITDNISSEGIIVRTEEVLYCDSSYVSITVEDGKKVSVNQELAVTYSSAEDMERAAAIKDTEAEIAALESLLTLSYSENKVENESEIKEDIYAVAVAVADKDFSGLESLSTEIRSLVISTEKNEIEDRLGYLNSYLAQLKSSSASGTSSIRAEISGVFSREVDGFETLTPESIENITPSELRNAMSAGTSSNSGELGKLITEIKWYYTSVIKTEDISGIEVGDTVVMNFGKYYNSDVKMKVEYISSDENGESVVTFSGDADLSEMLSLRQVSADMRKASYTGILVPKEAIHVDNGQAYVYTVMAMKAERKDVEIIYEMEDYYMVSGTALRDGNEVIVKADDLYDGKIIG